MGLMEDITQAVARMQDDDNMKGGRAHKKASLSKKTASKKKVGASKRKSKHATKHATKHAASHKKHSKSAKAATPMKKSASKRGLSKYNVFVKKEMPAYRAKHPKATSSEAMSAIAKKWHTVK